MVYTEYLSGFFIALTFFSAFLLFGCTSENAKFACGDGTSNSYGCSTDVFVKYEKNQQGIYNIVFCNDRKDDVFIIYAANITSESAPITLMHIFNGSPTFFGVNEEGDVAIISNILVNKKNCAEINLPQELGIVKDIRILNIFNSSKKEEKETINKTQIDAVPDPEKEKWYAAYVPSGADESEPNTNNENLSGKYFYHLNVSSYSGFKVATNVTATFNESGVLIEFEPALKYRLGKLTSEKYERIFEYIPGVLAFGNKNITLLDLEYNTKSGEYVLLAGDTVAETMLGPYWCDFNDTRKKISACNGTLEFAFNYPSDNPDVQLVCAFPNNTLSCDLFQLTMDSMKKRYPYPGKSLFCGNTPLQVWVWATAGGVTWCAGWANVAIYENVVALNEDPEVQLEWINQDSEENLALKNIVIPKTSKSYTAIFGSE